MAFQSIFFFADTYTSIMESSSCLSSVDEPPLFQLPVLNRKVKRFKRRQLDHLRDEALRSKRQKMQDVLRDDFDVGEVVLSVTSSEVDGHLADDDEGEEQQSINEGSHDVAKSDVDIDVSNSDVDNDVANSDVGNEHHDDGDEPISAWETLSSKFVEECMKHSISEAAAAPLWELIFSQESKRAIDEVAQTKSAFVKYRTIVDGLFDTSKLFIEVHFMDEENVVHKVQGRGRVACKKYLKSNKYRKVFQMCRQRIKDVWKHHQTLKPNCTWNKDLDMAYDGVIRSIRSNNTMQVLLVRLHCCSKYWPLMIYEDVPEYRRDPNKV